METKTELMKYKEGRIIAEDKITGFSGTITSHADYITGCDQYLLQPKVNDNGDFKDGLMLTESK